MLIPDSAIRSITIEHCPKRLFYPAAAASLQSCPTLCDPIDGSPPGSPVPGILQARTLERVAISFSNTWKWKVKVKSLSRVRLLATPWTAAYHAPPSMGFSRQECWSGVPLPSLSFTLIAHYSSILPQKPLPSPSKCCISESPHLFSGLFKLSLNWFSYFSAELSVRQIISYPCLINIPQFSHWLEDS